MPHPAIVQNEQDMLRSVERARRVLSESGRALVRATDETQFLRGMCRIAVELAGYSMAWVGLVRHDQARSIEAVASAGDEGGFLANARVSWADDAFGRGLSGKAVRSGRPQVAQDLHTEADFAPWRAHILALGHQANASLPLVIEGETIGVFSVFTAQANAFGAPEMELLDGVARDIAFGIQTLRLREAQQQTQAELVAGQRLLQATFEQAPAGIAHIDLAGRIIRANKKLETILGYGPGELIGLTVRDLSHAEDIDATAQERARLVGGEIESFTKQKRYLRKDGTTVWVGLTVSLMQAADGTVLFDIAVFEDITERVRLDALLRLEHSIIGCLAEAEGESAALQSVMRAICLAEGWACGRYFRVDEANGVLCMAEVWAADDTLAAEYRAAFSTVTYAPGEGLAGKVWQSGRPAWSADISVDPRVAQPPVARNRGLRGAFVFSVLAEGVTSGVLIFNSREVRQPDPRLIEAVGAIGSQIGQFLQRRRAEEALRASDARFRSLTALSADGFWQTDLAHCYVDASVGKNFSAIHPLDKRRGKTTWELPSVFPDAAGWAGLKAKMDAHEPFHEFELARLDVHGLIAYRAISGEPIFAADGSFTGYHGVTRDITARKREEALQRLSLTVTRALTETHSEADALRAAIRVLCQAEFWDCGRYYRADTVAGVLCFAESWSVRDDTVEGFLLNSKEFTYPPGVGLAGIVWQTGKPVWAADTAADARIGQKQLIRDFGMHAALVFPIRARGATIGVLTLNSRKLREVDARLLEVVEPIGGLIGQFVERKRAEETERRFRLALDLSADAITLVDVETMRYIDVNATACELQGYTREEMLRMGPQDVSTANLEELQRAFAETIASGKTTRLQSTHRRKDGSRFPIEVLRRAVQLGGRWVIVAILRDISDRVEAERNLRSSEARFRSLTALSSDGYWETDVRHRFVNVVNGARFDLANMPSAQIGKRRWELPSAAPDEAGWAAHKAVMDAHQPFRDFEFSRIVPDGTVGYRSISGEPMFGEDGAFTGYQGVARDITARKTHEAQLEEMNAGLEARVALRTAELERANKELEAFSYSVAHDLRAPLRAINSFSAIVIEESADKLDVTTLSYLRRVREGALRMGELVDDLLDLARVSRQKVQRKDLNLGQVAGKVIVALTEAHPQRKMAVELDAQMAANCDAALIEIVLVNLIGNAWKFSARVAEARIRVGVESRDGERVFFVRDNGAGFSMEYVKNLFEPFHRLHRREDFEGSGIGLSLVRRIIDKHGGRVWAEGEEGRGAVFYFTLG